MKAFIAGASGYTGRALVRVLRERGDDVIAHIRPGSAQLGLLRDEFGKLGATVDTTPWDARAFEEALARHAPDAVFALLGTTQARMRRGQAQGESREANSYESVDYGLTMMLLRATERSAPSARLVYLSSLGASETAPSEYLRVRGRVERAMRESSLPHWVSVRPSFITGEDRQESRPMERVGAILVDATLGVLGALGLKHMRDQYASMTADELAHALARVAHDSRSDKRALETAALRAEGRPEGHS